ncbi:SMI1/KNR4 family protein [Litchfieldella qijiaojingensis]|nr:SMI1/KNR4 family protein [Halomonas qijiaojingensis]
MLKNIHEVLEYYRALANRPSGFPATLLESRAEPLDLQSSGLGLPESYIDFVQRYKVEEVSVGMLELMPIPSDDIIETIRQLNGDQKSPYVSEQYVHVANFEGDLVLLVKGEDYHDDGRVFFRDISSGYFREPVCLANGFEDFIVIAANLDQRSLEGLDAEAEVFTDIAKIVNPALSDDGQKCWGRICEMFT